MQRPRWRSVGRESFRSRRSRYGRSSASLAAEPPVGYRRRRLMSKYSTTTMRITMMRVVRPNVTVKASMFIPSLHRRACRFTSLRCRRPCRATRSLLGLVMSESCRETLSGT